VNNICEVLGKNSSSCLAHNAVCEHVSAHPFNVKQFAICCSRKFASYAHIIVKYAVSLLKAFFEIVIN
jgi:hypothetical protein